MAVIISGRLPPSGAISKAVAAEHARAVEEVLGGVMPDAL